MVMRSGYITRKNEMRMSFLAGLTLRDKLPVEVSLAHPTWRRPWGILRTRWRGYICYLAWDCPAIPKEELETLPGRRDLS